MLAALRRLAATVLAGLCGYGVGWTVAAVGHTLPQPRDYPFLAESLPYPHHVPEHPGGLSFRFAMAHDVIAERFPRHGPAHYRERNRVTRERLAALAGDDPARFPLDDDLAAGLERLGRSDEAVAVMRDKLARQRARGLSGRALYTSYANLGTFLIHARFPRAAAGDAGAKRDCREGVALVRQAVEVNPAAHFGRERWQAAIAEFLLAALDDPGLLTTFDCLGNRLDLPVEDALNREGNWVDTGYGRPNDAAFSQAKVDAEVPAFFRPGVRVDDPALWAELSPVRAHVTKVGAEAGWDAVAIPSHRTRVPFDEPVLGIIGMWRQGGGANPHFALALGETMLRVGQRYIAWDAFERAARLADRASPDPKTRQFLRDHCRARQAQIEQTLLFRAADPSRPSPWQYVSPPPDAGAVGALRTTFEQELARGEGYQRAYQQYEADRLAAGVPIDDPHFFDAFHATHKPIASPVGPEERFVRVPRAPMHAYEKQRQRAYGVFAAGLSAFAVAALSRRKERRVRRQLEAEAQAVAAPAPDAPEPL
jgi:hypothetical protein